MAKQNNIPEVDIIVDEEKGVIREVQPDKKLRSKKGHERRVNASIYAILIAMSVIWLAPFVFLVLQSFRGETGGQVAYIIPKQWTLANYAFLFEGARFDLSLLVKNAGAVILTVLINLAGVLGIFFCLRRKPKNPLETTKGNIRFDKAKFIEEYGFEPKKLIDLKALMGDSSDNIPGVKGIGEKTAKNLLHEFGSLDGVYENLESKVIKPKQRENLVTYRDNAYLSYDLATIRPNAPIAFDPLDAVVQPYNSQELYNLFVRLEFVKLIDKYHLRGANVEAAPVKAVSEPLKRCDCLPEPGTDCALYLAPDGSIGVAWEGGVCAVTPLEAMCLDGLLSKGEFILHDCKSTWHELDNLNLPTPRVVFDTALAAYDLNPSASDYPVSKLATNFLGASVEDEDAAGWKGGKRENGIVPEGCVYHLCRDRRGNLSMAAAQFLAGYRLFLLCRWNTTGGKCRKMHIHA